MFVDLYLFVLRIVCVGLWLYLIKKFELFYMGVDVCISDV